MILRYRNRAPILILIASVFVLLLLIRFLSVDRLTLPSKDLPLQPRVEYSSRIDDIVRSFQKEEDYIDLVPVKVYAGVGTQSRPTIYMALYNDSDDEYVSLYLRKYGAFGTGMSDIIIRLLNEHRSKYPKKRVSCMDLGANLGAITVPLALFGCDRVYAFEANPYTARRLRLTIELNEQLRHKVKLFEGAVSSSLKPLGTNLHIGNPGGGGVFEYGQSHISSTGTMKYFKIQTVRIDDHINEDIFLMKVDIEGHEKSALETARRLFAEHTVSHIIIELRSVQEDLFQHFLDMGYKATLLHNPTAAVSNTSEFLQVFEKDKLPLIDVLFSKG